MVKQVNLITTALSSVLFKCNQAALSNSLYTVSTLNTILSMSAYGKVLIIPLLSTILCLFLKSRSIKEAVARTVASKRIYAAIKYNLVSFFENKK